MNRNKKECIEDLKYIKKAFTEKTLSQWDSFIDAIDTLIRYLEKDMENDK